MCDHEVWLDNVCGQHSVWSSLTIKVHQVNKIKLEIYATIAPFANLIVAPIENIICTGLKLIQFPFNLGVSRS